MPKLCDKCGEDHEMLFSKEVIALYEEICETDDPVERAALMIEMAELFVNDTDDTDEQLGEDVHDLLTKVIEKRVVYDRSAMALARVIMRTMPSFLDLHEGLDEEDTKDPEPEDPKTKAN